MYTLKANAAFDSAHFLMGYDGKCRNIHGHRWVIEAEFSGDMLQEQGSQRGMLLDFTDCKHALRSLADSYDHALICEKGSLRTETAQALRADGFAMIEVPFRPTAECFAKAFYDTLVDHGLPVSRVTVYETPDNGASYAP